MDYLNNAQRFELVIDNGMVANIAREFYPSQWQAWDRCAVLIKGATNAHGFHATLWDNAASVVLAKIDLPAVAPQVI